MPQLGRLLLASLLTLIFLAVPTRAALGEEFEESDEELFEEPEPKPKAREAEPAGDWEFEDEGKSKSKSEKYEKYEKYEKGNKKGQRWEKRGRKKKYFVEDTERTDAGIFHVGFGVGGNFYMEPKIDTTTKAPTGDYFKDFGFQAGIFFDYDYSGLAENIPLGLRGMIGYKYILNSVHVFGFDGSARMMFRFSDSASFGIGPGTSAAVWYRAASAGPPAANEEIIFLPSFLIEAGFEFTPFFVDVKWLINRFGEDSTITGLELYFGFHI